MFGEAESDGGISHAFLFPGCWVGEGEIGFDGRLNWYGRRYMIGISMLVSSVLVLCALSEL